MELNYCRNIKRKLIVYQVIYGIILAGMLLCLFGGVFYAIAFFPVIAFIRDGIFPVRGLIIANGNLTISRYFLGGLLSKVSRIPLTAITDIIYTESGGAGYSVLDLITESGVIGGDELKEFENYRILYRSSTNEKHSITILLSSEETSELRKYISF